MTEAMGGEIEMRTSEAGGTRVRVLLKSYGEPCT
jgi:signal transduction histidine kinase